MKIALQYRIKHIEQPAYMLTMTKEEAEFIGNAMPSPTGRYDIAEMGDEVYVYPHDKGCMPVFNTKGTTVILRQRATHATHNKRPAFMTAAVPDDAYRFVENVMMMRMGGVHQRPLERRTNVARPPSPEPVVPPAKPSNVTFASRDVFVIATQCVARLNAMRDRGVISEMMIDDAGKIAVKLFVDGSSADLSDIE